VSTQMFLRGANLAVCDAWGPGDATWNPSSAFYVTGTSVEIRSLRLSRGSSTVGNAGPTVASSTARHRFAPTGTSAKHWISPPIDRDVTIASTITFNLWMLESSMSANVQAGCYVARIAPDGTLSAAIGDSTDGVELGTAVAAMNWTQTATSLACHRGDRLLIVPYFTNIGTQGGGGFTASIDYDGATAAADGDSYVTFTEDFGFMQDTPSNTIACGTNTATAYVGNSVSVRQGFRLRTPVTRTMESITMELYKVNGPSDNLIVALQADSAGTPSGTDLASSSIAGTVLTTSATDYQLSLAYTLVADTDYWIVARRSGAESSSDYYLVGVDNENPPPWGSALGKTYNGSTWAAGSHPRFSIGLTTATSTLYPTTTAGEVDPNGATYDAKEAWTSRGSG